MESSKTLRKGKYVLKALIDGGGLCYQLAAGYEYEKAHKRVINGVYTYLKYCLERCETTSYLIAMDSSPNFRYCIYPQYKANRHDQPLPKWYNDIKSVLESQYGAYSFPGLEADDILSIEQYRNDKWFEEKKQDFRTIIISADKDLRYQVNGHFYRPKRGMDLDDFFYVKKKEKDRAHAKQLITGDQTDGIKGIEGIGDKKAELMLEEYEKVKNGEVALDREIEDIEDWAFYQYQQKYGYSLRAALYAINHNYNMVSLLREHPKYSSKYQRTIFNTLT